MAHCVYARFSIIVLSTAKSLYSVFLVNAGGQILFQVMGSTFLSAIGLALETKH